MDSGDLDHAIEHFSNAIEFNNTQAAYYSLRGLCYYRQGPQFARLCLADFNQSIRLDGKDPQTYFYRGSIRLSLALDLLVACEASANANASINASGAASLMASSSSTSSSTTGRGSVVGLSTHELAAEANGGLSSAHSLSAEDQLDAALADIELAWALSPKGVRFHVGVGMIKQLKKQYSEASALFRDVHHAARANVVVKYHWALCCHMLHDTETAVVLLCDCADAMPEEPLFVEARGLVLQEIGQHELAVADLSHAIKLREAAAATAAAAAQEGERDSNGSSNGNAPPPASPWNHYLRAESLLRLQQFESCVQDCTAALALPQAALLETSIRNARAMAHRGLGRLELAVEDLTVRVALSPSLSLSRCVVSELD
ncbi:hypothetical protein PINS_up002476 [Pythium insidiosum]|nr:hypothetical protein PINS_up002476 [Pythium insidiosum]